MILLNSMKHFFFTLVNTPIPSSLATQTPLLASPEGILFHEFLLNKYTQNVRKKKLLVYSLVTFFESFLF